MKIDDYQAGAIDTAIYPGQGTALGLIYTALKLSGEAGEFAEHVGKAIRDDQFTPLLPMSAETRPLAILDAALAPERRELLKKEIGDVLWYCAAAARELGYTLSEIAQGNLDKLADRKARGTLGGSGDVR